MNSDDYSRDFILDKLSRFENNFPTNKMHIIIFLKSIIDFFESDLPNTGNFGHLKNKFKELFNPNTERLIYFHSHTKDLLHTYLRKLRDLIEQDFHLDKTTVLYNNKNIFIVHGSDNEMKEAVARLLEILGLIPIILHEQPNEGKTIIEKFERYSDVGFAIILLSPDDYVSSMKNGESKKTFRARQNVILELGYFLGKLGRERTLALYKHNDQFEFPSDISGLLYLLYDNTGKWKYDLIGELKNHNYDVSKDSIR